MRNIKKYLILACILGFLPQAYASGQALNLQDIYQHLSSAANGKFKKYDGITYAAPTKNELDFVQTHNIWSLDIDVYNRSFIPTHSNTIDKEFNVPTCKVNSDCQGYSTCQEPDFTTDKNGNKRKLCLTSAYKILDTIYQTISNAKQSVDLTTLQPINLTQASFSTIAFTSTIRHAILALAQKSVYYQNPVQIRFLQGSFLPYTISKTNNAQLQQQQLQKYQQEVILSQKIYLQDLTKNLPANNKLIITVGSMRSCEFSHNCGNEDDQYDPILGFAFNHGKIIDVDNSTLITGGHNLYGEDYLEQNPVNDISVKLQGPIAASGTTYANSLWHYLCNNTHLLSNKYVTYKDGKIANQVCPERIDSSTTAQNYYPGQFSGVEIMPSSKLNNGVSVGNDADQSEPARVFAFQQAKHSIKISQQALFYKGIDPITHLILHPTNTIDGTVMQALSGAIMRGVDVFIVTSNLISGSSYSSYVNLAYIHNDLLNILEKGGIDQETAQEKLKTFLHLGYISYADGQQKNIRSHNKFWMVDDKIFYVGSHNIYPASLQEFGVIVDDQTAAGYVNDILWEPLWKNAIQLKSDQVIAQLTSLKLKE